MTPPVQDDEQQLKAIAEQIAAIGFCLPGTLTKRRTRCSSPGCRCRQDPPVLHGPYHSWTRKIAGKTVTRTLTPDQAQRYGKRSGGHGGSGAVIGRPWSSAVSASVR